MKILFLILSVAITAVALFLTYFPISKIMESSTRLNIHFVDIIINIITYSFAALLIIAGLKSKNKFSLKNIIKFTFQSAISAYIYALLIIGVAVLAALWLSLGH